MKIINRISTISFQSNLYNKRKSDKKMSWKNFGCKFETIRANNKDTNLWGEREREREKLRRDATRTMVYIFDLITRCLRVINEVEN